MTLPQPKPKPAVAWAVYLATGRFSGLSSKSKAVAAKLCHDGDFVARVRIVPIVNKPKRTKRGRKK